MPMDLNYLFQGAISLRSMRSSPPQDASWWDLHGTLIIDGFPLQDDGKWDLHRRLKLIYYASLMVYGW